MDYCDIIKYIGEYVRVGSDSCPIYGYVRQVEMENGTLYCYISDSANPNFMIRARASDVRKPTGLGYEKI